MQLGQILGNSFRALKSGTLWALFLAATVVVVLPYIVVAIVMWQIAPTLPIAEALSQAVPGESFIRFMAATYGSALLGGLLSLPGIMLSYGALIHASNAALAGAPFTFVEAVSAGARRFFRLFGIEFTLWVGYIVAFFAIYIGFFALLIGSFAAAGSRDNSSPAAAAGVCIALPIMLVLLVLVVLTWQAIESLSSRYAIVGDQTIGQAMSSGFRAFRARWRQCFGFGLVLLLMVFGYSMATSVITTPLFMFMGPFREFTTLAPGATPDPQMFDAYLTSMLWVYPVMFLLMAPLYLWMPVAWTAFFRNITGLDAPAVPAYPSYPSYPPAGPGGAPYPAASAYPPAAPAAPEPPYPQAAPYPPAAPEPPSPPHAPASPADAYPPAPPYPPAAPEPPQPPSAPQPPADSDPMS